MNNFTHQLWESSHSHCELMHTIAKNPNLTQPNLKQTDMESPLENSSSNVLGYQLHDLAHFAKKKLSRGSPL